MPTTRTFGEILGREGLEKVASLVIALMKRVNSFKGSYQTDRTAAAVMDTYELILKDNEQLAEEMTRAFTVAVNSYLVCEGKRGNLYYDIPDEESICSFLSDISIDDESGANFLLGIYIVKGGTLQCLDAKYEYTTKIREVRVNK